jgi:glutamate-ammonia-ligase adenylyltransferase
VVAGPDDLASRVEAAIGNILHRPRDPDKLLADVASMRWRMDAEHHMDVPWKNKYVRGGLVDLEFIAEYLQLRHGAEHPDATAPNTVDAFRRLDDAGLLEPDQAAALISASLLMRRVRGMLRLTVDGVQLEHQSSEALRAALARTGEAADFEDLRKKLLAAQANVREIYARLIDQPAAKVSE